MPAKKKSAVKKKANKDLKVAMPGVGRRKTATSGTKKRKA